MHERSRFRWGSGLAPREAALGPGAAADKRTEGAVFSGRGLPASQADDFFAEAGHTAEDVLAADVDKGFAAVPPPLSRGGRRMNGPGRPPVEDEGCVSIDPPSARGRAIVAEGRGESSACHYALRAQLDARLS